MAIFLQIEGIKGDVTEENHQGWINCDSLTWGISRNINTPVGVKAEREYSVPTVQDVMITTQMDKATPELVKAAAAGTAKKATIHLMQVGGTNPECYMEYVLDNALVTDYQVSVGMDGMPTETISLNFTKISMKYTIFNEKNKPDGNVPGSYDLTTGKPG